MKNLDLNTSYWGIFYGHKLGLIVAIIFGLGIVFVPAYSNILADGENSPVECTNAEGSAQGNDNILSVTAPAGEIVDGVCIKSGSNMFGETGHSGVLGNGTFEDGCYSISGVGTATATVTRVGSGSDCQELSHIDGIFGTPITPVSSPSPSPSASPSPSTSPSPSPSASPSPSPSASPSPSVSPSPSPTPSPSPSASPSPTPTPTPAASPSPSPTTTVSGGEGGTAAVAGAVAESSPEPTIEPAVLGASAEAEELPATGIEIRWFILGLLTLLMGIGFTTFGLKRD
ncbi:MAG: hypothetical protein NUV73_03575 [Candidatus Daviesbacteria bacterium]|nr:hypothetical protein [Candidatus Daviesbacteria bacterium]